LGAAKTRAIAKNYTQKLCNAIELLLLSRL
jgi:hypothetical protein